MEFALIIVGIVVGILSGFFGIGGGTVSIPILLYLGFDIKQAIGISVFQMLLSSYIGYLIHRKQQTYAVSDMKYFGFGGIAGAILGSYLVKILDAAFLGWLFLSLVLFTLIKLFLANPAPKHGEIVNRPLYALIGGGIGVFSGMLGVGGSILMTPILVSFLGFGLKKASAVGLFFVMFSSVASFVTLSYLGMIDFKSGGLMAIGSIAGIFIGIFLVNKIQSVHYKKILVAFYIMIFMATAQKLIWG